MKNDFEIRTASLSASEKKLTGYVVKWSSRSHLLWDEFVEQFAPNAFSASLTSGV
ncbi:peptidase, partial [Xenorhabdus khoisanae]